MKKIFLCALLFPVVAFPAGEREILGVFAFKGGFVSRMILPLASPRFLRTFRLDLPAYCKNVEILEAGSVTEGVEDLATPIGDNRYSINGGSGERVSALFATLNGPEDASCNIPVLNGDTPAPPDGKIQGTFLLDGVPKLTIGSGNRITDHAFRLTNPYGYSAPIVFTTALALESPLQYRAGGNWTDVFTLPSGQTVQCTMPVSAIFAFDSGYDGVTLTLNFPQNITYTGADCMYEVASQSFFLQRRW